MILKGTRSPVPVVAETAGIHLLVRLWSPAAAWILTGLSVYTAFWLIGDYHALRLRPVRVSGGMLNLRLGLRWSVSVPVDSVAKVGAPASEPPARKDGYLKAVLIGAPNRRVELAEPVRANGFYGISRQVTTVELQIDEPGRFDAALERTGQRS